MRLIEEINKLRSGNIVDISIQFGIGDNHNDIIVKGKGMSSIGTYTADTICEIRISEQELVEASDQDVLILSYVQDMIRSYFDL